MASKYMKKDIALIVSGKKFMANKAIISEKSDYFKAMFSSGMLESRSNQIKINGISSKGFGDILWYMHGLALRICMKNVLDLLAIADYIQINDAIKLCEEFLILNVDAKNYSTVANIAEWYSLVGLKEHVLKFIDKNIWDISQTEFFYKLTPEQIHHAVKADIIINFSELDLLEAILQWGLKPSNLTIEEKLKHVEDMLGHVRFYEISKKKLNDRLKIIFSENSANHLIHEKITQLSMLPRNSLRTKLFSTRGLQKVILRVGKPIHRYMFGFGYNESIVRSDENIIISIECNFINDTKWIKLTSKFPNNINKLPAIYRSVVLNNEVYMIVYCFDESASSFAWKFSHKTNNWDTVEPMNVKRLYYSICEVDDKAYAVGGFTICDRSASNIVQSYDPIMETWGYIESLPEPRYDHASVNFGNIVYISGGYVESKGDDSMLKYNPSTNTWLSCAPLLEPRIEHVMMTYGDKIYVCGGWCWSTNMKIEEYDVANDSWRFVTTVPGCYSIKTAILVESKIYIFYNHSCDSEFYEIDCYDVETNEWSKELKENKYFEDSCSYEYHTMYLPKSLADD